MDLKNSSLNFMKSFYLGIFSFNFSLSIFSENFVQNSATTVCFTEARDKNKMTCREGI